MAHVAISSDLRGSLFAVDHNGDVFRNWHARPDGTGPLVHAGLGQRIGSGWSGVRHLAAVPVADATYLAGIGADGNVIMASSEATGTPTRLTGAPSGVRFLFPGAGGALYMVTGDGTLHRQTLAPPASPGGAAQAGAPTVIEPAGWGDELALFTNSDGLFFSVTLNGSLRYQRLQSANDAPSSARWVELSTGWSRYHQVFGAGMGGIYAIGAEGSLERRQYTVASDGTVHLEPRTRASKVGQGLFPWTGLAADIEGYAWPMSLSPGDTVEIKVGVRLSTPPVGVAAAVPDPVHYSVDFRRLRRWHDGTEAVYDEIMPTAATGQQLTSARYLVASDLLEKGAQWATSFSLQIPDLPPDDAACWRSGVYAARLTDTSDRDFYVPFVVRPKRKRNPFVVLANSNTWNAYNSWGGQGKYTHTHPLPSTLPFQRPHPGLTPDVFWQTPEKKFAPFGPAVYTNSCHLLRAELWVLGWLEDLGPKYAWDIFTDQDLHEGKTGIGEGPAPRYKAVILNTHPEYWTGTMYDRLRAHRDQGGSIIYLGGNGIYEEVGLSPDGAHMRIFPGLDVSAYPSYITNEQLRLNCLMRAPAAGRPEHALLGVGFQNCEQADAGGQPYVLQQDPTAKGANPVLAGLTIKQNGQLGATSHDVRAPWQTSPPKGYFADGWEVDQRGGGTPPAAFATEALLAIGTDDSISGEMLCYRTEQGGVVFAAASLNFGASLVVDSNLQRIVQNALDLCLSR